MEHDEEIQKARDEKLAQQAQRQDLLKTCMEHQLTAIQMYLTIFALHMTQNKVPRTFEGFLARERFLKDFVEDVKDNNRDFSNNMSCFLKGRAKRCQRDPPGAPGH
jgi:hypothetical protein